MKIIYNWLHQEYGKLHLEFGIKQTWIFLLSLSLSYFITGNILVSLIGALVPLLYFLMPNTDIKLKPLPKIIGVYLSIISVAVLGSIATVNVVTSLTLNLIIPFVIVCILTNDNNILGYVFHYIMFTYVQFAEVTPDIFPMYLVSAFIGVVIAYIFNEMIWAGNDKETQSVVIDNKKIIMVSIKSVCLKIREGISFNSSISKFGIRLSIVTAVSITLWSCLDLPKWYWIAKATCYTLVPIWSLINYRAVDRFKSTAIGCIAFFTFSLIAPNKYIFTIAVLLALVLAFSYIPKKHISEFYSFSAFVSLSLSLTSLPVINLSFYKVTYVLIGVVLAVIMNRLVLPNEVSKISADETTKTKPTTVY